MTPSDNIYYSNNVMRIGVQKDRHCYAQLSMRESRISPMTADDV
jgi:hypothetical protein